MVSEGMGGDEMGCGGIGCDGIRWIDGMGIEFYFSRKKSVMMKLLMIDGFAAGAESKLLGYSSCCGTIFTVLSVNGLSQGVFYQNPASGLSNAPGVEHLLPCITVFSALLFFRWPHSRRLIINS